MRLKSSCLMLMCLLGAAPLAVLAEGQRLELDAVNVIGSRELPQVVHILSWQSTRPEEGINTIAPSLHDPLQPLDRKVLLRELRVIDQLQQPPTDQATP
ncbi:MAG: hypothetical protein AB1810_05100 [Pseudomonadota bacterium]